MSRRLKSLALALALATLGGCVAYTPVPVPVAAPQPSPQQRFDRAWSAAAGAMADQGVVVSTQDRGTGVMRGARAGVPVTATVQTQADGNVQVSFETVGAAEKDPGLTQRLRESYLRRMGH
jgi:predicted small lipoprotein YifL